MSYCYEKSSSFLLPNPPHQKKKKKIKISNLHWSLKIKDSFVAIP